MLILVHDCLAKFLAMAILNVAHIWLQSNTIESHSGFNTHKQSTFIGINKIYIQVYNILADMKREISFEYIISRIFG